MSITATSTVDVRTIPPRERHALIFSTFRSLAAGQAMELVNDHDPQPLFHQFQAQEPGRFGWAYIEAGPLSWRVAITKVAPPPAPARGGCCGSCGGA